MIGAIIGDIVGSRFEGANHKSKEFELFAPTCRPTDDSIMTLAVGKAIMESERSVNSTLKFSLFENKDYEYLEELATYYMQKIGRQYPDCGYGGHFINWIFSDEPKPYNSYGNGAAMRVSAAGLAGRTEQDALERARRVTKVSHNHREGLKGAEAVALAIYMARKGLSKRSIFTRINADYYSLDFKLDDIKDTYRFDASCQGSVPQAIKAFLEGDSFEDTIRTAVSIGGDSDTIAAIAGSIAEPFYGIPDFMKEHMLEYLDTELILIYEEWQAYLKNHKTSE